MAGKSSSSSSKALIKQSLSDMVQNIEAVMVNINNVLGEVTILVKEIDTITERIETHYEKKLNKCEVTLDANRNHCECLETPGVSNNSKSTMPSPYIDYTYLELTNDCDTCQDKHHSFTYNEKYPLWIQYDSWKTETSVSEMSVVSSGSDSNRFTAHFGSDGESWKSGSDCGWTNEHLERISRGKCKFEKEDVLKFSKCCNNTHDDRGEIYCGVYEEIMEQQLEDSETTCLFDCHNTKVGFTDSSWTPKGATDNSVTTNKNGIHDVISYDDVTSRDNSNRRGVIVREYSDSCSSSS